jgi:hypothetical protein
MRLQSEDTDLQAERAQIDLLCQSNVSQRVSLAISLSETTIDLARRAIRIQNANFTDRDILLRFVAIHYGPGLAESVDKDLQRRAR